MKKYFLIIFVCSLCACQETVKTVNLDCDGKPATIIFDGPDLQLVSYGVKIKDSVSVSFNGSENKEYSISQVVPDTELTSIVYHSGADKFYIMQGRNISDEYHLSGLKDSKNYDITCKIKK